MNNTKDGNLHKIIAAIVIGVVLILMIGIIASGSQNTPDDGQINGETDNTISNDDNLNGDTDNFGGTADNIINNTGDNENEKEEEFPHIPDFTNYLTGLECSEEDAYKNPYVFVIQPNAPLYGISSSDITIEMPIENGDSRFLLYTTDVSTLGKIGAFAPTRNYMTQLTKLFGGIMVAYGEDDLISYDSIASTLPIDLSKYENYIYRENGKNIYTDNQNLKMITNIESIDIESYKTQAMPFEFCDFYDSVSGKTQACKINIPYSDFNSSTFEYDAETNSYKFLKNNKAKVDMLSGDYATYENVFILFSDVITYELSSGIETVVDSATKGTGYYITNGTLIEIRWSTDSKNQLIFEDLNSQKLTVNRGNSYIGYYKASDSSRVTFE